MITKTETGYDISITDNDLVESIGLLKELRKFFGELPKEEGRQETIKALTTAIETMTAFYCEKFGEDETDEIH